MPKPEDKKGVQRFLGMVNYVAGKEMILADTLSRAHSNEDEMITEVHMVYANCSSEENLEEIKTNTLKDITLNVVANYITNGWPQDKRKVEDSVKPYWSFKEELTLIEGIIFKGQRILIPTSMRKATIQKLHLAHMGIEKTKMRARETVFWPGINKQIEDLVKSCETCLEYTKKQTKELMISSEIPNHPFQIVGTDLFHWNNQDFIIVVDYYSRYWKIERLHNIQSQTVIKKLKMIFSRLGIPQIVRSDNGTQFTSSEFQKFSKEWEFKHITSSSQYQQSNGME
nr:uncharacterized protein K02A2.6-like [Hydra vulgaris]